ncbi:MAG: FMN-binding negative transcriptional regulator [Candidatus Rokubacteria bacterium]|nr:FMN-binding negative transcriptional regulator [Candidatus Rokubacteria bacterium]MBI3825012.1 FMN-binding negative transcriptional regulator [Candidatus Rokubacteria bacterium]
MIFHEYYTAVPDDEVERFVQAQELGRLVTIGAEGQPHIGLYPFVTGPGAVELHLVRADEQIADLERYPRCLFEVDEVLGVIPSYWVHAEYGGSATAYHRTVMFDCEATIAEEPAAVAAQQEKLLARYQPEGGFRRLAIDDPLYRGALEQLAAVRLGVVRRRVKFKLAQNRPPESRRRIIEELRRRGRPTDARAAEALQWTLDAALGTASRPPA